MDQSECSTRLACAVIHNKTSDSASSHLFSLFLFLPLVSSKFWVTFPNLGVRASFSGINRFFYSFQSPNHVTKVSWVLSLVSLSGANEQHCRLEAIHLYSLCPRDKRSSKCVFSSP